MSYLSRPPLQFSLLSEVRGIISPQDLDCFDHLVLRREIESMKARQPPGPGVGDTYSMVSYSDTASSTGSHGTSTTVSSARVSRPCPILGEKVRARLRCYLSLINLGFLICESLAFVEYLVCDEHGDSGHLRKINLLGLSVWGSQERFSKGYFFF